MDIIFKTNLVKKNNNQTIFINTIIERVKLNFHVLSKLNQMEFIVWLLIINYIAEMVINPVLPHKEDKLKLNNKENLILDG